MNIENNQYTDCGSGKHSQDFSKHIQDNIAIAIV